MVHYISWYRVYFGAGVGVGGEAGEGGGLERGIIESSVNQWMLSPHVLHNYWSVDSLSQQEGCEGVVSYFQTLPVILPGNYENI